MNGSNSQYIRYAFHMINHPKRVLLYDNNLHNVLVRKGHKNAMEEEVDVISARGKGEIEEIKYMNEWDIRQSESDGTSESRVEEWLVPQKEKRHPPKSQPDSEIIASVSIQMTVHWI